MKATLTWLFVATVSLISGYGQTYPDDPSLVSVDPELGDIASGKRDKHAVFPDVQESRDINGDGVPEIFTVHTIQIYTTKTSWTGRESGKAAINALAAWLYDENMVVDSDGNINNYVVLSAEPCLSAPKKDNGGNLIGMKISYVSLVVPETVIRMKKLTLNSTFCFLPWLGSDGKPSHTVVSMAEASSLQKKLAADFLKKNSSSGVLWQSMKGHFRKDGQVSFGGVWLSLNVPMPVQSLVPKSKAPIARKEQEMHRLLQDGGQRDVQSTMNRLENGR